jgi:polysaccharide pyruvyl transferase WcaK-like protein
VGIGYNLFPGEVLHCKSQLIDVLQACREREFPFAVRNDGSWERLRTEVGTAASDVVEIPDPGFFVRVDADYACPQQLGRHPSVLLQVAGDNLTRRLGESQSSRFWMRTSQRRERQFVDQMAAYIGWLVDACAAEVVLAPHIARDISLTGKIFDRLPPKISRPHVRMLGITHPLRAAQFFQAYARSDLVVGMRGHSVICAVGLRVPCLALATHQKVSGFMRKCGLAEWSIDWSPHCCEQIRDATRQLLTRPEVQLEARDRGTADFEQRFQHFMQRTWETATRNQPLRHSA